MVSYRALLSIRDVVRQYPLAVAILTVLVLVIGWIGRTQWVDSAPGLQLIVGLVLFPAAISLFCVQIGLIQHMEANELFRSDLRQFWASLLVFAVVTLVGVVMMGFVLAALATLPVDTVKIANAPVFVMVISAFFFVGMASNERLDPRRARA